MGRILSLRLDWPFIPMNLSLVEVINMDLFFSGLTQRASEQTWNERRSQFSKVHEIAIQVIEMENSLKNPL